MIRVIIWDLDGVIVDSMPYHYKAWAHLAKSLGITFSKEYFQRLIGMKDIQILQDLFSRHPQRKLEEDEMVRYCDFKAELFQNLIKSKVKPLPGVIKLIKFFKKMEFQQAIGSSTRRKNIELIIDVLKIRNFFDLIVSGEDVEISKPDPEIFLKIAEKLGADPKTCLVIEDSLTGLQAAKRAGMKVILVSDSYEKDEIKDSDLVVKNLEEVDMNFIQSL